MNRIWRAESGAYKAISSSERLKQTLRSRLGQRHPFEIISIPRLAPKYKSLQQITALKITTNLCQLMYYLWELIN